MAEIAFTTDGALLRGATTVLEFDGVASFCTFPVVGVGSDFTVEIECIPYDVVSNGFLFHPRAEKDYYLRFVSGNIVMSSWSGSSNNIILASEVTAGAKYSIICTINGTSLTGSVNGVPVSGTLPLANTTSDTNLLGSQDGSTNNFEGLICCVKITTATTSLEYIRNSDFGSSTLVDHSGNGKDGTINGATWGKTRNGELVEFWDDWELYYNQLPVTPVEFQNVTRIDVYSPDTDDPLWELYTSTWLVVTQQDVEVYFFKPNTMSLKLSMEL